MDNSACRARYSAPTRRPVMFTAGVTNDTFSMSTNRRSLRTPAGSFYMGNSHGEAHVCWTQKRLCIHEDVSDICNSDPVAAELSGAGLQRCTSLSYFVTSSSRQQLLAVHMDYMHGCGPEHTGKSLVEKLNITVTFKG